MGLDTDSSQPKPWSIKFRWGGQVRLVRPELTQSLGSASLHDAVYKMRATVEGALRELETEESLNKPAGRACFSTAPAQCLCPRPGFLTSLDGACLCWTLATRVSRPACLRPPPYHFHRCSGSRGHHCLLQHLAILLPQNSQHRPMSASLRPSQR